jgi:hypothetical protein
MSPFRSRYVTVQVAVVGELPAVVETEDEQGMLLALATKAPPGLSRMLDRPVRVECTTPRGIQRVVGTATWDAASPDLLTVRRDSDDLIQRRDTVRVQAVVPARLSVTEGDKVSADTTTLNVSVTGVLIKDPLKLALGTPVRLELALDYDSPTPLVATGAIVRDGGHDEKGVHIKEISRPDQSRLTRFVTDRQRAELRIARGG